MFAIHSLEIKFKIRIQKINKTGERAEQTSNRYENVRPSPETERFSEEKTSKIPGNCCRGRSKQLSLGLDLMRERGTEVAAL